MDIFALLIFLFGLAIGSFLNVLIYRIPRNISIITPSSFCPFCKKKIKPYDNIPLFSYVFLKGKCRNCKSTIPFHYPFVELATSAFFLLLYRKTGLTLEFLTLSILFSLLIVISFIDMEFSLIPDSLSIGGIFLGLILSLFRDSISLKGALSGALFGGGILFLIAFLYESLAKREGMGGGDIKLLAMIGSFTGIKGALFSLISGSFFGTIFGIGMILKKRKDLKYAIPFGPFLSLGATLYILWGKIFARVFLDIFKI